MANAGKVTTSLVTAISKIANTAISGIANIAGAVVSLFTDTQCASKSITTGSANAVYITDSDGYYTYDQADAVTISFWVKVGWNSSLNTNIHLFSSTDDGSGSVNNDTYRIYYHETYNRMYIEWRSGSSNKCQNFWLFHDNTGVYAAAYAAAGLCPGGTPCSTYWNSSNRGNVGDDDYTLITFTRSTTNTGCYSNLKLYWNATDCGEGYYSVANGKSCGNDTPSSPSMGNLDKQIAVGSNSWNFSKCGNDSDTEYDGVSIWNVALSGSEVTEIYNNGTPMNLENHSRAANLVGFWNYEGNGNNTVSGGPAFTVNGDSSFETK
jgi:hypothetical protein